MGHRGRLCRGEHLDESRTVALAGPDINWNMAWRRNGYKSMYARPKPVRMPWNVGCDSFRYLPELLLDLCVKCIQLLLDRVLSLRRRLCSNVSYVTVAKPLFLTSNFICESLNIKSPALSLILLKVTSPCETAFTAQSWNVTKFRSIALVL